MAGVIIGGVDQLIRRHSSISAAFFALAEGLVWPGTYSQEFTINGKVRWKNGDRLTPFNPGKIAPGWSLYATA